MDGGNMFMVTPMSQRVALDAGSTYGGYITIDEDYRIDVSKRLYEDYGNGRDYYKQHDQRLLVLPERKIELPSKEFLRLHNENVFLA